ncbi:MAG: M1 family metallopeptidase [Actinomycetota bacterium]
MTDAARLSRSVVPHRYDLEIAVDLDGGRFEGRVRITLEVTEAVTALTLHAHELDLDLVAVEQRGQPRAARLVLEPETERVTIALNDGLDPGPARCTLAFSGKIADGLVGIYRSTFVDDDGRERTLAATQFEAPHARRAFPCFDEPEFKAVFGVTLVVDDGLVALSNGPEIERIPTGDGRVAIRFADTIPMSTYLAAFVIGPLEISGPVEVDGVPIRVAHVPGRGHLANYALDVGPFALHWFRDYYGIPYPGQKYDLVALPDFAFGAMENLGCVTFRETLLLADEHTATQGELTQAALTIVHETAHMWFGDLVTMKWWNGIWLNEAFATFMEHAGVDAYRPDWKTWEDFAVGRALAMDTDALSNTRPVEYEVHTPEDADGMFDTLTYQKGGSVVRMLEQWMGADAFRDGVRHYLDKYRFANTETTDLWDALEEATGRPARRIMDSWILQPGFPKVVVERGSGMVRLSQRRFAYGPTDARARWTIPLLVRVHTDEAVETRSLLLDADSETEIPVPDGALVVVNAGGEGFYRVAYPPEWRSRLVDAGVLGPLERFAIVDDAWAALLAGTSSARGFLELAERFAGERDLIVWRALVARLRDLLRLVDGDARTAARARIGALARPSFDARGWKPAAGEAVRDSQLRALLVDALGTIAHDREVVARARELWRFEGIDPDLVAASIAVAASHGTKAEFDEFVVRVESAATPQEQLRFLHALGQFPAAELVLRASELSLSDEVRAQNAPFVLQRALRNVEHGRRAWEVVAEHWDHVEARFPKNLIGRMLEGVTWLVDDRSIVEIPQFLHAHPVRECEKVIDQHLERQQTHRAVWDRDHDRLAAWLAPK